VSSEVRCICRSGHIAHNCFRNRAQERPHNLPVNC